MRMFMSRAMDPRPLLAAAAVAALSASAAQAQLISFPVFLDGPSEAPPNASPGTGVGQIDIDPTLHTLRVSVTFSGLLGNTSAAHIHAATAVPFQGLAGVATQVPSFMGFPLGVTEGTYDMTFDTLMASTYNPTYINNNGGTPASAEAALFQSFAQGRAYLNIHSTMFPGGEIRGFLPAPGAAALLGLGGLCAARRRRN